MSSEERLDNPVARPRGRPTLPKSGRTRLAALVLVVGVIGLPAAVLRVACVGRSCEGTTGVASAVPFCSLSPDLRQLIGNGFRAGRSADVLGVARTRASGGTGSIGSHDRGVPWPSTTDGTALTKVPILFWGTGINPGARVPPGTGLDQIAPTIARVLDFRRPHPDVRAGQEIAGVASGTSPRLVLEIVLKYIGSSAISNAPRSWPYLEALMHKGAGSLDGRTQSLPVDPAATLTTIGTGGLPYQHGITGLAIRNDRGKIVRAWGAGAPVSVISTLEDDFDRAQHEKPLIGLVAPKPSDRGVIGGNWYLGSDKDRMTFTSTPDVAGAAGRMLRGGFGSDDVPDVLVAVLGKTSARPDHDDRSIRALVSVARSVSHRSVAVVIAGTGQGRAGGETLQSSVVRQIERSVPAPDRVVAHATPGGLFLDQSVIARDKVSEDDILKGFEDAHLHGRGPVMDQVFPALAVSFERYC